MITIDGAAGLAGFSALAVRSVAEQPPTVLVCMNRWPLRARTGLDGVITHIHEMGSHSIFIAEMRDIWLVGETQHGLAYFNRAYHQPGGTQICA